MKMSCFAGGLLATALCLANPACAKDTGQAAASAPSKETAVGMALERAMMPGEGQKRLEAMIGTFDHPHLGRSGQTPDRIVGNQRQRMGIGQALHPDDAGGQA